MKRTLLSITLLLGIHTAFSQTDDASKYAATIAIPDLQKQLTIIASDEFEGRETGTEGQRKAAAYIESQFRLMGLKMAPGMNGYQQFYPLYKDTMLSAALKIGDRTGTYETDFIIPMENHSGKFQTNEIVFAGYGIEDKNYNDYDGINVKGKLVVIVLGEPKKDGNYLVTGTDKSGEWTFPGLSKKLALAATKEAAGVIVLNPGWDVFSRRMVDETKSSRLYYPTEKEENNLKINYALVTHGFAKDILGDRADYFIQMAKTSMAFSKEDAWQKAAEVSFGYENKSNVIEASNVLGLIEGTDKKDEYVFLTAHYDHLGKRNGKIYYGADDDGSGTVAVIQMAAAFLKAKAEGKGPRRTIVFMTVSGEEKGLWGSEYYSDHPVLPLDKTSVDLNTDMVGRIDTERKSADTANYVYVVGHDKISSDLPLINEAVNKKYTNLTLDYKFDDPADPERIYFRSDHYNFARKGVPVLFFYDGMLKADYHKPTDTVDKINWQLYEKRVHMIFHTAWEMANRDEMLKRDKPIPTQTR